MSQSIEQVRAQVKALKQGDVIEVTYRGSRTWPPLNYPKTDITYFVEYVVSDIDGREFIGIRDRKGPPWEYVKLIPLENIDSIVKYIPCC
jgi:hypothetical protein